MTAWLPFRADLTSFTNAAERGLTANRLIAPPADNRYRDNAPPRLESHPPTMVNVKMLLLWPPSFPFEIQNLRLCGTNPSFHWVLLKNVCTRTLLVLWYKLPAAS